jgi:hypothetical protein
MIKRLLLILAFISIAIAGIAQMSTNVEFLRNFAIELETEWQQMQQRVHAYANQHNLPISFETADGRFVIMFDVIDGQPIYYETDNYGASLTTRAHQLMPGGNSGLELTGEGYDKLGVWDGGRVRNTHVEFTDQGIPRVTQMDNATTLSDHATHVAGTMVAAGINSNARGMAYAGLLKAYNSSNDNAEMTQAAADGMEISNHSYSQLTGWSSSSGSWQWYGNSSISPDEDYKFGFYGPQSRTWDIIAYNAPNYLISKSAGNNRGEGPSYAGQPGYPEKDGGEDGYDCIPDRGTAKNVLSVGAVLEVANYTGPHNVIMSSFSGWGPCDDGRIKPDIVAKGVGVFSAGSNSDTHYSSKNGTSMSTPNAAGTMALLQQHYQNLNDGTPMRASTLKGLVIHTADEAGSFPGPDYIFGWGLMNAERAAEIISENSEGQNVIDEIVLANGGVYERHVTVGGGNPLRVTISWTDPPGVVLPAALNDRTPSLVHDLDLRIEDENGMVYYPWKLDPDDPAAAATNDSKNYVDNVEMVHIDIADAGLYTIIVDHEGMLNPNQVFSMIISGIDDYSDVPFCSGGLIYPVDGGINAFLNLPVEFESASFASSYDIYFGTDGDGVDTPSNILNAENVTSPSFQVHMEPSTTYYLQVVPRNNVGPNTQCDDIWSFTTMPAVSEFPFIVDVEDVVVPDLPEFWHEINYSSTFNLNWESTSLVANTGSKSMVCYSKNGQVRSFDNWLISPPIAVNEANEYLVSFHYRGFFPNTPEQLSLYWGLLADTTNLNNLAFNATGITTQTWLKDSALIIPGHSGHIFLAWHANNPNGIGVFIDDIMIEDWGLVGIEESLDKQVRVYYADGALRISSGFTLEGAEIKVMNAAGQTILTRPLPVTKQYQMPVSLSTGVYIIQLRTKDMNKTTKLFIN